MSLHDLGCKYGTDKVNNWHTFNGKSYLQIYEKYFLPKKEEKINILEIGVKGGHSLRTWKEYFPNANICGLDFNPECLAHEEERIEIFVGSQDDPEIIKKIVDKYKYFDIIIDDGSHINDLIIKSFNLLSPFIKKTGIYIIEDLNCSYEDLSLAGGWDGELDKNEKRGISLSHNRQILDDFFKQLIHRIDTNISVEKNENKINEIESIHFYSFLSILIWS